MATKDTRTARIEMHPAGCVIVRVHPITQTVDDARENVAASIEIAGGMRRAPILIDIRRTAQLIPEVRQYYLGGALANNFTALGLLVDSTPMGRMMGNVFFRLVEAAYEQGVCAAVPTRLFEDDDERAVAWLTSATR